VAGALGSGRRYRLLKLKNRIINFRVTDDELARLKSASDLHGARCLSDFARTIILGTASGSSDSNEGNEHIEEKIHSLDGRLSSVEAGLLRVINMLSCAGHWCRKPQD
jgi:hypothetical protein